MEKRPFEKLRANKSLKKKTIELFPKIIYLTRYVLILDRDLRVEGRGGTYPIHWRLIRLKVIKWNTIMENYSLENKNSGTLIFGK